MPFRPYTREEIQRAAQAYGVDPAFAEAVYAKESSNGTDPNAMRARSVRRKNDYTIVRGPFQMEDGTANEIIRRDKLGKVNVEDPEVHLDLAMRLMRELQDRYDGDPRKMAQAYHGGPGGVTNPNIKDELGMRSGNYANDIVARMAQSSLEPTREAPPVAGLDLPAPTRMPGENMGGDYPMLPHLGADAGDIFGMSDDMLAMPTPAPDRVSWGDLVAANRSGPVGLGLLPEMGELPNLPYAGDDDVSNYLTQLVNEEMDNRDYTSAAAA